MFNCKFCNKTYKKLNGCRLHEKYCKLNPNRSERLDNKIKNNFVCQYCGRKMLMSYQCYKRHETFCKCNPNRKIFKGHTLSDAEKNNLSQIMKEKHKLRIAPTWAHLRGKNNISYPEQWLMNVIKKENINTNYIHEYPFYSFSLDFAWVDDKKVIEMDGRFHKISKYQQDCDKRKDELLKKNGWKELRIDWEYCCNNSKEIIQQIKEFLL